MRSTFRWIDRHLWVLPLGIFLLTELGLITAYCIQGDAPLLARVGTDNRKDIYSSLTGTSSGLLGFTLAAVAIMAAFGKRVANTPDEQTRENNLAGARVGISKIMLSTSILLMIILVAATLAIGIDGGKTGSFTLTSVITAAGVSSVVGIIVSCAGLTLSLVDRSQHP